MVEAGVSTLLRLRMAALRMRAIISPRGSVIDIRSPPLPAGLDEARNLAVRTEVAPRDPAHLALAGEGARTSRQRAPVAVPGRGRVARQLGELEARFEALLQRTALIVGDRLQ